MTKKSLMRERAAVISSTTPSAKKSSLSPPRSSKGITTRLGWPCGRGDCLATAGLGGSAAPGAASMALRSEEHTSELQSLMRISYAVFCLKKKNKTKNYITYQVTTH